MDYIIPTGISTQKTSLFLGFSVIASCGEAPLRVVGFILALLRVLVCSLHSFESVSPLLALANPVGTNQSILNYKSGIN